MTDTTWTPDTLPFAWVFGEDESGFSRVICGAPRYVKTMKQAEALDYQLSRAPVEAHIYIIAAFSAGCELGSN